jgi:hypothetical protein
MLKRTATMAMAFAVLLSAAAFAKPNTDTRPECFRSKNCVNRIGRQDRHNCVRISGKSWKANSTAACVNI